MTQTRLQFSTLVVAGLLTIGCASPLQRPIQPPLEAPAMTPARAATSPTFEAKDGSFRCEFPPEAEHVEIGDDDPIYKVRRIVFHGENESESYAIGWIQEDQPGLDLKSMIADVADGQDRLIGEPQEVAGDGVQGAFMADDPDGPILVTTRLYQRPGRVYIVSATGRESNPELKPRTKKFFESFTLRESSEKTSKFEAKDESFSCEFPAGGEIDQDKAVPDIPGYIVAYQILDPKGPEFYIVSWKKRRSTKPISRQTLVAELRNGPGTSTREPVDVKLDGFTGVEGEYGHDGAFTIRRIMYDGERAYTAQAGGHDDPAFRAKARMFFKSIKFSRQ